MIYVDILGTNLKTNARKLGLKDCFHFQWDSDPKHSALCAFEFLLHNAPCKLLTPSQSPNKDVIENLWSLLEVEVRKKKKYRIVNT